MNIALEKTEEFVNGKLRRSYGDAFVRGNNGSSLDSTLMCHILIIDQCFTSRQADTIQYFHAFPRSKTGRER